MSEDWLESARRRRAEEEEKKSNTSDSSEEDWLESARRRRVEEDERNRKTGSSGEDWLENARQRRIGDESRKVDEDYINAFIDSANSFFESAEGEYNSVGWGNASSTYQSRQDTWTDLDHRRKVILQWMESNRDLFEEDSYNEFYESLNSFGQNAEDILAGFSDLADFYSQWDTEAAYNRDAAQAKEYEEMSSYDLEAAEEEIRALEAQRYEMISSSASSYLTGGNADTGSSAYGANQQVSARDRELAEINAQISRKKQYLNLARHLQEGITLAGVVENADFDQYKSYVSTKSDSGWDRLTSQLGMGYEDLTYEYINNQNGIRDEINRWARALYRNEESPFLTKGYDHMTEDQIAIYNYYYAKEGKEKAQEYLDNIQETLNNKRAEEIFAGLKDKTALEMLFGVEAGLDQFKSGMKNFFNFKDDYIAQSAYQMASGMVREDLGDVGFKLPGLLGGGVDENGNPVRISIAQVGYDAITTTANMAPSILTSLAANVVLPGSGAVIGSSMMGVSAAGGAYQEALNAGYDKGQARAYSTLVGASEAGLQYLLGGVKGLGGKLTGKSLTRMLDGIDNALARTALQIGGNMLSEGFEEGLQEVLTPLFKSWALQADEDINWSEVAYSSLLGSLTAGFMEGPSTIYGEVKNYQTGKQLQAAGVSAESLAEIGSRLSADTVAYRLAGKVNENTGAYTMGRLFNEIGATMTEQNVNDIAQAMIEKGVAEASAKKYAGIVAKIVDGAAIPDGFARAMEADKLLAEAVRETIIDTNTTWYQRNQGYNEALMALAQEKAAPKASRTNPAKAGQENTDTADTVDTAEESGSEGGAKAMSIASIQNGQATVRLEDGSEVGLNEANLDPDEAARIETIAGIDGISREDANFILATLRTAPASRFDALGAVEAYRYGFYGVSEDHVTKHSAFAGSLNESQRKAIYNAGRKANAAQTAAKQAAAAKKAAVGEKNATTGKVHLEGDRSTLTERQSASLTAMEKVAEALGVQIYVFESFLNEQGIRVYIDKDGVERPAPNGWYDQQGNIHIDLNAGQNGEGTMLFTLSHELTHHIRKWSPAKFKALADFLMEEYGKKGVNVDGLVREQINKAWRSRKEKLTYDAAFEEVVADSMEMMLSDGNVMEKLAKLKAKDKSLWQKIKDYISEVAAKIRSVYEGLSPDSVEGRYVAEMKDAIEKLQDLFVEGLVDASENYQARLNPGAGAAKVTAPAKMEAIDPEGLLEEETGQTITEETPRGAAPKPDYNAFSDDDWDRVLGIAPKQKPKADEQTAKPAAQKSANSDADVDEEWNRILGITPGEEGVAVNRDSEPVAYATEDGSVLLSMRTYEEDGRKAFRDYLQKCVKNDRLTKAEMQEMLNGIEEIYGICKDFKDKYAPFSAWSDAAVVRDTHGRPVFSVVIPNGDYKMNLDFSLVCKKRRTLDAVFNEMSRRGIIDDFELGQKSVVKINEIIRKYGLETACALCFVDAKRFRQASMADSFTSLYNELVESLVPEDQKGSIDHFNFSGYETIRKVDGGIDTWPASRLDFTHLDHVMKTYGKGTVEHKAAKYIKTHAEGRKLLLRGDFMSSQGFDAVKTQNKDILKLYNSKKGTGGPKAAFGDVQYMNEIIKKARTWTPNKAYAVGGVRIQSFSDYVPRMVFDYAQMIYDLAATKLPAHAYTKEALFVKQFGLTGVKINMSLIPAIAEGGIAPGLDAKGNYVWAGESFDFETAKQIQNAPGYTENCGTICVGVSQAHIEKLLADPDIRMVIPYHKSGLNPIVAHMNKIAAFTDYTDNQRTKGRDGKAIEKDFDFSKAMHDMGDQADPRTVADQYLKWCASHDYRPRFHMFAHLDGYYKLLEDFTLYDKDGRYVPQREVRAVFPKEGAAFGSMKDLIREGLEEDAVVEGKRDSRLSAIVDEIQKTLPRTEAEIEEKQVQQADRDLEAEVKYSLREIVGPSGKNYGTGVCLDSTLLSELSEDERVAMIKEYIKEIGGSTFTAYDNNHNAVDILLVEANRKFKNKSGKHVPVLKDMTNYLKSEVKQEAIALVDELILASTYRGTEPATHPHDWVDNNGANDWDVWTTYIQDKKNTVWEAKLRIANSANGEKILYDIFPINKVEEAQTMGTATTTNKVTQPDPNVKKFSDRDSTGKQLTAEQQEFFKDSKVRDADGNLLRVYHGTNQGKFTVFDWDKTQRADGGFYGRGHYFTAYKGMAERYGSRIVEGYLNIKNPFVWQDEIDGYKEFAVTDVLTKNFAKRINMARVFPKLFANKTMNYGVLDNRTGEMTEKSIKWSDLEKEITKTMGTLKPMVYADGAVQWSYPGDFWDHQIGDRYESMEEAKKHKFEAAAKAFVETHTGIARYMTYDDQTTWTQDFGSEISDALMEMGYDGAMQNRDGEEIVAFQSNQFKNADNANPTDDPDIRYSDRDMESVSNRSLLANALEGAVKAGRERDMLRNYKTNLRLIRAEEQRLQALNSQIRELSFAKGPRDTKKISDLRAEAQQTASRINAYDRELLKIESMQPIRNVLEREKKAVYQRAEKKGREAIAAYREKAERQQREIAERYRESRKKAAEGRDKTAMRHKVQNVVKELNDLLLNESKKRHVPDSLKKAVADALSLVNMDTVGAEERAAYYADLIAKEQAKANPDQAKIDAYTATMENILRQGEKMGEMLTELHYAYEKIKRSDDPDIANAHDPVIAGCLEELSESIGNTSLRNMTMEQLSDVYDMYRMVLTRVRDANKTFLNNRKEAIGDLASRVVDEVRRTGGKHTHLVSALDPVRKFGWNNLKPVYAFEHIGSGTLTDVFREVRSGEDVWAKDVTEAREYYLEQSRKYGYDKWDFKKKYRFESNSGLEFELSLEQILSLYAYSKREQAHDHLRLGGFVFDSNIETYKDGKLLKYKVNTADAHQITPEILADIIGTLTEEQRGFVDEMQNYLSTTMGAKGNEVTMKMYGVKLFKEKHYFPLKSAKQFMFEQNEVSGEVKIKNSGFTNKVVAKANNPVILSNFMEVWSSHVNDMSMYHAFVLPLEDFNRVFNYNSPKSESQPPVSVKGTIQNAYGPAAVSYVKNLITDLNGGARTDSTTGIINKMLGLFKKGSVFASLSVVVQQPSAIARAAALVDTKYFIGPRVDPKRHKVLWDEVKRYAPVAIIKEMGYFDTNMGKSTQDFILGKEYSGFSEKMKALVTDSDYRDEVLSKAPALADELAWCSIWEAVKRETQAKNPGMAVKSEEFLKKAGQRFTEVITKTQVYDSVLARSANMRSKDTGMKMATAFMAEPTTSINMIADALLQGKRGNRKYCRAAIGAVIASQIFNSILVSFVYAGRDDDEDKTYAEKYIESLTGKVLDSLNPFTYIPFIKDIVSIVQGYDVERSDMAVISDLWNAWQKLDSKNLSVYRKVEDFAGSIAQIFGLPVKNIMRDVRGIWQTYKSFTSDQQTTKAGLGYAVKESLPKWLGGGTTSKQNQLYEAYLSGDQTQIARVESRYKDQSAMNTAVRSAIKECYLDGEIDYETAIDHLVKFGGMDEDEAFWKAEEWTHEGKTGEDFGKYNEFFDAVRTGKNLNAVIKKYTDNGVKESTLKSQLSDHFKPLYMEMSTAEKANIKGYLLNAFERCGMSREDAEDKIAGWQFEADHPELVDRISFSQYQRWEVDGKPYGVSLDMFADVAEFRDNGTSGNTRSQEEVKQYIMSVTSDNSIRHALWCCFYKASTSPWH